MRTLEALEAERLALIEQKAHLDGEIATITKQLDVARQRYAMDGTKWDTDWFHKASDAKIHKSKQSQQIQAQITALNNERKRLNRAKHHGSDFQSRKARQREIAALYRVAHAAYEMLKRGQVNPATEIGLAIADLNETVPGWDKDTKSI